MSNSFLFSCLLLYGVVFCCEVNTCKTSLVMKSCCWHMRKTKVQILLCSINCSAQQSLFCYIDSTIPLPPKSKIPSLFYPSSVPFVSDLVRNPEDGFPLDNALLASVVEQASFCLLVRDPEDRYRHIESAAYIVQIYIFTTWFIITLFWI